MVKIKASHGFVPSLPSNQTPIPKPMSTDTTMSSPTLLTCPKVRIQLLSESFIESTPIHKTIILYPLLVLGVKLTEERGMEKEQMGSVLQEHYAVSAEQVRR